MFRRGKQIDSYIPYAELSITKKRKSYIDIKNNVKRFQQRYGVPFFSYEDYDAIFEFQWTDIYFLSQKYKHIYYNATVQTLANTCHEKINEMAIDKTHSVLIDKGINPFDYRGMIDTPDYSKGMNKHGKALFYAISFLDNPIPSMDNKTVTQLEEEFRQDILAHPRRDFTLCPRYTLDCDYASGIGLEMHVDYNSLNKEIITDIITDFWDRDERDYQGDPVDMTKLFFMMKEHAHCSARPMQF